MKRSILFLLLPMLSTGLFAQTTQEVATGAGYKKQSFFSLASGTETQVNDNAWDIAFSVSGLQDAGIFINESAGSSMGAALPGLEVYWTIFSDFSENIDPATLTSDFLQWNDEKSWNFGAFNAERDTLNQLDLGWGEYNPATNSVEGTDVFVVKLRDGSYKKVEFQSLVNTTYTFRYANLDGSDEQTRTVNKADHAGKLLAYFSFTTGTTANVEPAAGFDLIYWRYMTKLPVPGTTEVIDYLVTGIVNGKNVTAAKADGIDPATVQFATYADSFGTNVDVIGQDWKSFSGTAWSVDPDRVYFVRTADSHVWKLHFTTFGGSTTGKAVFEKTDLGIISGTNDLPGAVSGFEIFPNPATTEANILLELNENPPSEARLSLFDATGHLVLNKKINVQKGLNGYVLPTGELATGTYFLNIDLGKGAISKKLIKN